MKRFFTFTLSLLLPALLFSANKVVLSPGGSLQGPANEIMKVRHSVDNHRGFSKITPYDYSLNGVTGTIDTLGFGDTWGTNFGMFGQDIMTQWFEAPADMDINAVSFTTSDDENAAVSVKLVSMAWTKDQIQATQGDLGASWWGYYEATGNGFNDVGAYEEDADVTGGWVEAGEGITQQWGSPFGADLWSDLGEGAPATAVLDATTWVEMSLLGFSPQVLAGDLIGVSVKNESTVLDAGRTGLLANNALGVTGFKMYRNGRLTAGGPGVGDPGWWTRLYTWNIQMAVELTGDRAPVIVDFDRLPTTLDTGDRTVTATVTDDNPSGNPAGVASVKIMYSINGGDAVEAAMTGSEPDFSGVIPGQAPGTEVDYYLVAEDNNGNTVETPGVFYAIFAPQNPVLTIYDDDNYGQGTITAFWLADLPPDTNWVWGIDYWDAPFGPVSLELLENYQQVYHLMGDGPVNQPANIGAVYKSWMDQATAESPRNLFLSGQDYGYISGFADTTFPAGSFENDYLGVETLGPQDINFAIQDQSTPYRVDYVAEDPLSGWIATFDNDTSKLSYNPTGPLGLDNWIDNLTPSTGVPIFTDPNTGDAAVAVRNQGENWKATFWTMDPLGLDYIANADSARTYWVSGNNNPAVPVFEWFGETVTSLEEIRTADLPRQFKLKQNYPNPFNPATKIEFSIPAAQKVVLKVYDVVGKEVATLVNDNVTAGTYVADFDASNLASGLYVYTIEAGSFRSAKKMLLVK
jgi:hypothetical protein